MIRDDTGRMIEFFFDCSSPWTYLALHNLPPLAKALQVDIRWRPILVGGVFNSVNPSVYAQRDHPIPAKLAYMKKDLQDWARVAGLQITMPPAVFPVNSVKAMRGCIVLQPQGKLPQFARAVFDAYWCRDQDISQDQVLGAICLQCGVDPAAFLQGISSASVKQQLKDNTEELVQRGGFGSPTLFVGDEMFFGNDRLELVRLAVLRQTMQRPAA